jgi:hypothetical protein
MTILFIVISAIFGFLIGRASMGNGKAEKEEISTQYLRRGIIKRTFTEEDGNKIEVVFEIGEVEYATKTMSKVSVISLKADRSEFNIPSRKESLRNMIDGSWVDVSDAVWIDDTSKMRNEKIEKIIGK